MPNTTDNTRPQRKSLTKEHLKRYLKKEMWRAGFTYSWRKMEVVAQQRDARRQVFTACAPQRLTAD